MRTIQNPREKLLVLALLALYVIVRLLFGTPCPILALTGIPCPGCGMSRACLALLRGDVVSSLSFHGMVWSLPILLLLFLFDGRIFPRRWANILMLCLLGCGFLSNWIVKLVAFF